MTMPSPPAHHSTGDSGHTDDHNTIAAILGDLQAAVAALQGRPASWALDGGNVAAIPGTGTGFGIVTVSAVNRDSAPDILDFYYGSQKIFSLNSYGELRLTPAELSHVAQVIYTLSAQTADAWQVLSPGLSPLARVGPDGSASFAGPVSLWSGGAPAAWQHPALQPAAGWTTYAGRTLACKLTNDAMVQLTGQLVPGQISDGTIVATMPAGFAPLYRPEVVHAATFRITQGFFGAQNDAGLYLEIEPNGALKCYSFSTGFAESDDHVVISGRYPLDAQ